MGEEGVRRRAEEAAGFLQRRLGALRPQVGVVLGSGLGGLASVVEGPVIVPCAEIPGFPEIDVEGHTGELVAGTLGGVPVVVQSGRAHLYEGHPSTGVTLPVGVFGRLGVRTLVLTNAAGGINRRFPVPCIMLIADHVNLAWRNPLIGPAQEGELRFPDMSSPYDADLRAAAREAAMAAGIPLVEGVYAGVLGPSYETPAEIRMVERLGADAIGMSTVPETIAARARGMRVLGLSTITNAAAGVGAAPLSHDEVLAAGRRMAGDADKLVRAVVRWVADAGAV